MLNRTYQQSPARISLQPDPSAMLNPRTNPSARLKPAAGALDVALAHDLALHIGKRGLFSRSASISSRRLSRASVIG